MSPIERQAPWQSWSIQSCAHGVYHSPGWTMKQCKLFSDQGEKVPVKDEWSPLPHFDQLLHQLLFLLWAEHLASRLAIACLREAPAQEKHCSNGLCPNSFSTPPPLKQPGALWELFSPKICQFFKTAVLTLEIDILTITMVRLCS